MAVLAHTHKLKMRKNRLGIKYYFCVDGKCTFEVLSEKCLGKITICWRCGKEFNLDVLSYRLVKPHCPECTKFRKETVDVTSNENKRIVLSLADRLKAATATAEDDENDVL